MKPSLQLKLSQHLALTPQLQQSIKLLQLSTIELNQEIEKVLLENPMIERDEPENQLGSSRVEAPGPMAPAGSEAAQEREQEQARESDREREPERDFEPNGEMGEWQGTGSAPRDDDDDADFQEFQAAIPALRDHLDAQIALTPLSDRDRALCRFMIEALDDDGYLSQSLEDLLPLLPPRTRGRNRRPQDRPVPDPEPRPGRHRCHRRQPVPSPAAAHPAGRRDPQSGPGHRCRSPRAPGRPGFPQAKTRPAL
ncbi:hypothetical protein ZRA01_16320 [Zoogloea ramigera]|uniref:RNA polymerase sigma factor 54 core-binding domain-containing protein n=1 Tax=Zoogloea ramigera TaxID=350 RepID=A0A4Y4CUU2_ZOORA|nr:hypothetical protein ZRA01_16320 [Zoogloea ramigera]